VSARRQHGRRPAELAWRAAPVLFLGVVLLFGLLAPGAGWGDDVQYCPKCGTENIRDARYCKNCGAPLLGEFLIWLRVTAPVTSLYVGDVGVDTIIGQAERGTTLRWEQTGKARYRAQISGAAFSATVWVDKAAVEPGFNPELTSRQITGPLTREETSQLLDAWKSDHRRLLELTRWGHIAYQGAILRYKEALESEWNGSPVERERAQRLRKEAEELRQYQDRFLQRARVFGPDSQTP